MINNMTLEQYALESISPIDGRYYHAASPLRAYFSEQALIKYRVFIEIEWLIALSKNPDITEVPLFDEITIHKIRNISSHFNLHHATEIKTIEKTTNHDVKAVEYFIKQQLANINDTSKLSAEFVHFACTSEDINNLAYALMIKEATHDILLPLLEKIALFFKKIAIDHAQLSMLSRTHGQPASPTTLGKELANIYSRINKQIEKLEKLQFLGKFNGAVGNFNAHHIAYPEIDWINFSQDFIKNLGLTPNLLTTQIEPHDNIAEFCYILSNAHTILIDISRDIWGYISLNYFTQKSLAHEVGSSTMPHKVNPIDFENAEGNFGMANALLSHFAQKLPISRFQRDLSDSTVLRNLGVSLAYGYIGYVALLKGLNKLEVNTDIIKEDLSKHPEVLTEAIQTVMRRYGLPGAYEQLKALSRGNAINLEDLQKFVNTLDLPKAVKNKLASLTPLEYTGLAEKLTSLIL